MKILQSFNIFKTLKKLNKKSKVKNNTGSIKSFRLLKKRDKVKPYKLPGYFIFTKKTINFFWHYRKIFTKLLLLIFIVSIVLIGLLSQDSYQAIVDTLNEASGDFFNSFFGQIESASLLFLASLSGSLSQSLSIDQQIYLCILAIFLWVNVIWIVRNLQSGVKIRLRDSLYNSGSPILSVVVLGMLVLVQFIPIIIALISFSAASFTGILNGGVESMMFWMFFVLLVSLSFYWLSATLFAMIIATIPGMYPIRAYKSARDLINGNRFQIVKRLVWLFLFVIAAGLLTFVPIILFDIWIKSLFNSISWLPIIPIMVVLYIISAYIFSVVYIYMLYREMVYDEKNT